MSFNDLTIISWTFAVYILFLLWLGFIAYRRTINFSDYILGGRKLGTWVASISAGASDMSGWLLLGLPGYVYSSGLQGIWLVAGLWCGSYLNWRLVARRLRIYSEIAKDSLTLPEYLNQRFADKTNSVRFIAAIFTIVFFLIYTVSGLVASGKLFNAVFGIPYEYAILIGLGTIMIYTLLGGFLAVSWTDLFQGLLMLFALIFIPMLVVSELDGLNETIATIKEKRPEHLSIWLDREGQPLSLISILSLLAWGLGYFGQPHILARFKAVDVSVDMAQARRIAMGWTGLAMTGAICVGLFGYALFANKAPLDDPERVFILLVNDLLTPVIAGICLAAILAAIMSTADSQLLVSASVFTEDIYRVLAKKQIDQKKLVWIGRLSVVCMAIIAAAMASDQNSSVLGLVAYAWAGFGAAFGPVILLSLFVRNLTRMAAFAGILSGALTVIIWKHLNGGLFDLYELLPGFVISLAVILIFTKFSKQTDEIVLEQYDNYQEQLDAKAFTGALTGAVTSAK